MFDAILKNDKLMAGVLGGLIRAIPPAVWEQLSAQLQSGIDEAKAIRATLDRIEAAHAANADRLDFLESIVRNSVDGAGAALAERDLYRPDTRTHIGGIAIADIVRGEPADMHTGGPR